MKKALIGLVFVACAAGCGSPQSPEEPVTEPIVEAIPADDLAQMKAKVAAAEDRAAVAEAKEKSLKTALAEPDPEGQGEVAPAGTPEDRDGEMCWADYCPCDTSDPDYGYADIPICRNLKMGVHVDDKMFSLGAMGRDARRSIREHKEQYGGDF
jgi:hypothetical protein